MIKVFIENEAGSRIKNIFNEKTLTYLRSETVSAPYPFPYGFILNTTAGDGDNIDCFVVTKQPIKSGSTVDCHVIDLLEQVEDDEIDHKIIVVPANEMSSNTVSNEVELAIRSFVLNVFSHIPGKKIAIGELLGPEAARQFIADCTDKNAAAD